MTSSRASGGSVVSNGTGNTPFLYGSAVACPETHYPYEKVLIPACMDGMNNDGDGLTDYPNDPDCESSLDNDETGAADGPLGPWHRIKYTGSEIGSGMATDCQSCQGGYVRVGVPTNLGWELSPDNPLPSTTNAVRFAVGELVVGEEYFAEISLRVTGRPLDPNMNADVNCSEVFGGDAAMPQNGQDNTWRYFVPAPACVSEIRQQALAVQINDRAGQPRHFAEGNPVASPVADGDQMKRMAGPVLHIQEGTSLEAQLLKARRLNPDSRAAFIGTQFLVGREHAGQSNFEQRVVIRFSA